MEVPGTTTPSRSGWCRQLRCRGRRRPNCRRAPWCRTAGPTRSAEGPTAPDRRCRLVRPPPTGCDRYQPRRRWAKHAGCRGRQGKFHRQVDDPHAQGGHRRRLYRADRSQRSRLGRAVASGEGDDKGDRVAGQRRRRWIRGNAWLGGGVRRGIRGRRRVGGGLGSWLRGRFRRRYRRLSRRLDRRFYRWRWSRVRRRVACAPGWARTEMRPARGYGSR